MRGAPHGLHVRTLFRSAGVRIEDVRCRPAGSGCGGEEVAPAHGVAFVRRGVFVKHLGTRRILAGGNHMVLFDPEAPYRVSHPAPGGDDCTSVSFDAGLVREALGPRGRGGAPAAFRPDLLLEDPRSAVIHHGLRRLALAGTVDGMEVEECAMSLLRNVARALRQSVPPGGSPRRGGTRLAQRRLAEETRLVLNLRFADKLTLPGIARSVASSPYHLARVFRREVGIPIHRYLNRLRLRAALVRLAEGDEPLVRIAFEAGFSSHAHLTQAFRREFGLSPSEFRRGLTAPGLRRMSKILEAADPLSSVSSS